MNAYEMDKIDNTLLNYGKSDIFTPDTISKIMASYLLNEGSLLDPCVGNGALLKFIDLNKYNRVDVFDIKEKYLKCVSDNFLQNKKHCNAHLLDFLGVPHPDPPLGDNSLSKYNSNAGARGCPSPSNAGARGCPSPSPSNIILNPPFIKIQDLSAEYREYIKNKWPIFKEGNFDLYFVFLLKCLEMLDKGGVMVSVTPNSYLYNKSAIQLRKYIIDHRLFEKIIDYGSEKIFPGTSVYCCITVFTKKPKDAFDYNGKTIDYNGINNTVQNPSYNIFNQTNLGRKTLKDICLIRNGIATLRDKIFIHKKKIFDEPCWKEITNAKETKYIIFPYKDGKIIDEDEFQTANPKTYSYLFLHKEELAKRDKGNKVYPKWYSFGRSQSLKPPISPKVIYIPTFIDPLNVQFQICKPILFYSCLCIEPLNPNDIDLILYTIEKNMELIQQSTSKRGGGWINLSSRILYELPIS
jgi:hypothetical protein